MGKLTREQALLMSGYIPLSAHDVYSSGGGIHIKPSHEGRFTAYKKRTGKTTEEALHSKDPHVRQMANFARNAAHWKHQEGGTATNQNDQVMQLLQMYAQYAAQQSGQDPNQVYQELMQQLQQMEPEQQQQTIQQIVQQVQQVQSAEQENPQEQTQEETMEYGGAPKYPFGGIYGDKSYSANFLPDSKFNSAVTNTNMLMDPSASPLAGMAATGFKPAKVLAGFAGAASALAGSAAGYAGAYNKLFSNPNKPGEITKPQAQAYNDTYGNPNKGTWSDNMWNKYGAAPKNKLGAGYFQDGGSKYKTGNKVEYGTPEYTEAYNKGEVVTKDGTRSPISLDEVVIQNNYKRPRGFWEQYADKIVDENKDAGPLGAAVGTPISAVFSLPQLAMMKAFTGKMQRPSEAMDIENPYGAVAVDVITDPTNLVGAGVLTKEEALAKLASIKNSPRFTKGMVKGVIPKLGDEFTNAVKNLDGDKIFYDNTATENFPTGEWKYVDELPNKGGVSETEPFNTAVDEQIVKATYGERPLVTPDQIYSEKEIADIVKKRKQYNEALEQFSKENPDLGGSFFDILSGVDPYMDKFHNLHPNLEFPGFEDKFTADPFLMKQNQPRFWKFNSSTDGTTLRSAENLDFSKDWYHKAKPKDYVSELRGSLGLSLSDIQKMSEDQLKSIAEKLFEKRKLQQIERFKKDIETPFTGKEAFKTLNPNKYGGLTKAQFGFNFNDPFGMQKPRFGQTANYADTTGYTNGQPIRKPSYATPGFVEGMGVGEDGYGGADNTMYDKAPNWYDNNPTGFQTNFGQDANNKGYAFPKNNVENTSSKTNSKTINNTGVSGQRMANNSLIGLGGSNSMISTLTETDPNTLARWAKRKANQDFEAAMVDNPLNPYGIHTTNVQGGGNEYIPNRYTSPQDFGTTGNVIAKTGGQMNFAAGGQYKVSHDQLLQLLRDGAEIEFL